MSFIQLLGPIPRAAALCRGHLKTVFLTLLKKKTPVGQTCSLWHAAITSPCLAGRARACKHFTRDSSEQFPDFPNSKKLDMKNIDDFQRFMIEEFKDTVLKEDRSLSVKEWENIKEKTNSSFYKTDQMVWCGRLLRLLIQKSLPLCGKSFYNYLKSTNTSINLVLLSLFMNLFSQDKNSIQDTCELYETFILPQLEVCDPLVGENIIHALSRTNRWLDGQDILKVVQLTSTPTKQSYFYIMSAALRHGREDIAMDSLNQLAELYMTSMPRVDFFKEVFQGNRTENFIFRVLSIMEKFEWWPDLEAADVIKKWFDSTGKWMGKLTVVNKKGICQGSGEQLLLYQVSTKDFKLLQDNFLQKSLLGDDPYINSDPQECQKFLEFLKRHSPFDIVIDGMNVASLRPKVNPRHVLAFVTSHFAKQGKKVLVIRKKHMRGKPGMEEVENTALTYDLNDITRDDYFLLYATLYSGQNAMYVSNDTMGANVWTLDSDMLDIFKRWQKTHRIAFHGFIKGRCVLRLPVSYQAVVQQSSAGWHIPFVDRKMAVHDTPLRWLFLRKL